MKLPHIIKFNRFWPTVMGRIAIGRTFAAATIGFWTFLMPNRPFSYEVLQKIIRHEYQHVKQFATCWAVGLALWLMITPAWWWLFLTPFTFTLLYGLASLVAWISGEHPYRANFFERDARRRAGEPVA